MDIQEKNQLFEQFKKTKTFKCFYSTLLQFDESLNCFVATEKWRNKEAELLTSAWWMFEEMQAAKAQAVPETQQALNDRLLVKSIREHVESHIAEISVNDLFDKGWLAAMKCIQNNIDMLEAQEPVPLKVGDLVEPKDHRYTLASGACRYPYAYVVNTDPFQLISEEGDMYWSCTVEADGYKLLKSNAQLPKGVVTRMVREGLIAPVKAQEPTND